MKAGKRRQRQESEGNDEPDTKKAATETESDDSNWDDELHRQFVSSIFEIGMKHSSPAVILENMTQKPKSITSERVKSKLQKYRNNKEKSRQEFIEEYEAFLLRLRAMEGAAATNSPMAVLEMMGLRNLIGGDVPAFLTYAVMRERAAAGLGESEGAVMSSQLLRRGAMEYVENFGGTGIPFPQLTEEEKQTSLGISMTFVMGLFLSMSQHLMRERERLGDNGKAEAKVDTPPPQQSSQSTSFSLNEAAGYALSLANSMSKESDGS